MIRRPPRSTQSRSSAASDVYKRQDVISSHLRSEVAAVDIVIESVWRHMLVDQHGSQFPQAQAHPALDRAQRRLLLLRNFAVGESLEKRELNRPALIVGQRRHCRSHRFLRQVGGNIVPHIGHREPMLGVLKRNVRRFVINIASSYVNRSIVHDSHQPSANITAAGYIERGGAIPYLY